MASAPAEADDTAGEEGTREVRCLPTALENESLTHILRRIFGLDQFRGDQETICEAVVARGDVLVVAPTGLGKSLCYQLPTIALGGTALVISPLIALMRDQVGELRQLGLASESIYSGHDEAATWRRYLRDDLQFLFVSPERLTDRGIRHMLGGHKPSLVVVDEAHCISSWGCDFRPHYRHCGPFLEVLRPTPIVALTATAPPGVQDDIIARLGLKDPACFIYPARRENIAIYAQRVKKKDRLERVYKLLQDPDRRPAIVYTRSKRETGRLAEKLNTRFRAAAYHADFQEWQQEQVHKDFRSGKIEVIVATMAFGMGINKANVRTVVHTYLPAGFDGYYQEIGRAGRDGEPSRAVLLYSYADCAQNIRFLVNEGKKSGVMETIFSALNAEPQTKAVLRNSLELETSEFNDAVNKLWSFDGATVDFEDKVTRGSDGWSEHYDEYLEQKGQEIKQMYRYAKSDICRMSTI